MGAWPSLLRIWANKAIRALLLAAARRRSSWTVRLRPASIWVSCRRRLSSFEEEGGVKEVSWKIVKKVKRRRRLFGLMGMGLLQGFKDEL
ncbi:hypothetical protein M5K25_018328 [Dendrobium thyrsiflorum]|uniref:Uncharacterized protein n=1 Tax=Dendrobium thyrsiflorum TaxID=117978 RepID=A0ABD0UHS5_DENTH